jgi:integrase
MRVELNQDMILRLSVDRKPLSIDGESKKIVFGVNDAQNPWILFDSHRKAPVGFGVKVGKSSKTYIVQRKVDGKVIKIKVGNVSDFDRIDDAREAARLLAVEAKASGVNPTTARRQQKASEITVEMAFQSYVSYLKGRPVPVKSNTLDNIEKSKRKLDPLLSKRVRALMSLEILQMFDKHAATARTATEQAFRWASVAVKYAIKLEAHEAAQAGREPLLKSNPFDALTLNGKYRTRAQLDEEYRRKGVRNPLSARDTLGSFLEALWKHRGPLNATGVDYLLLMLLWGNRKSESACLQWRDVISDEESVEASWVCLKQGKVHFYDTKNRRTHVLPLTQAATEILRRRQEEAADRAEIHGFGKWRRWVFPARSRYSKTGHYSDAQSLLKNVASDAGIPKLTRHDLRRSFGRLADELGLPMTVVKRLLNHSGDGVTALYTEAEWGRVRQYLQRVEDAILATSPSIYNALRPLDAPPINVTIDSTLKSGKPIPKDDTLTKRRRASA